MLLMSYKASSFVSSAKSFYFSYLSYWVSEKIKANIGPRIT